MSIVTNDNQDVLRSAIEKAGTLPEPITVYCGIAPELADSWFQKLTEARMSQTPITFEGINSFTRDPDLAIQPGVMLLLSLQAITGLPVPNDMLELLQCDSQYMVVNSVESPENEDGSRLEIFYLEEVSDGNALLPQDAPGV